MDEEKFNNDKLVEEFKKEFFNFDDDDFNFTEIIDDSKINVDVFDEIKDIYIYDIKKLGMYIIKDNYYHVVILDEDNNKYNFKVPIENNFSKYNLGNFEYYTNIEFDGYISDIYIEDVYELSFNNSLDIVLHILSVHSLSNMKQVKQSYDFFHPVRDNLMYVIHVGSGGTTNYSFFNLLKNEFKKDYVLYNVSNIEVIPRYYKTGMSGAKYYRLQLIYNKYSDVIIKYLNFRQTMSGKWKFEYSTINNESKKLYLTTNEWIMLFYIIYNVEMGNRGLPISINVEDIKKFYNDTIIIV